MNDTMEILIACAERLAQENLRRDPDGQKNQSAYETRAAAFRSRHGGDKELMDEVNELQDAYGMLLFLKAELLFFLGLQMGLELGKIDLLRDGPER